MQSYDELKVFKAGLQSRGGTFDFKDDVSCTTAMTGIIMGVGSSADPIETSDASKNFGNFYTKTTDATGADSRGLYWRHYLGGAGGSGEAGRFYTTVTAAGAVAAHGIHASVSFSGSGTLTGEAAAGRFTLHVPSAALGGTAAAGYFELWADGAAADVGGNMSFIRCVLGGNGTGLALIEDDAAVLRIEGGTNASGNLVGAVGNEPTWSSNTYLLRANLNGVAAALVAVGV